MWMYIWMDDHEWMIDWMNGNEMFTEHAFNESKCVIKYFQRNLSCWLGDHRATEGWLAQADPWTTKALHRRRRRIIGTVSVLCVILYIIVLYYHYVLLYMIISCQSSYFQRSNKFGPLHNKKLLKRALLPLFIFQIEGCVSVCCWPIYHEYLSIYHQTPKQLIIPHLVWYSHNWSSKSGPVIFA